MFFFVVYKLLGRETTQTVVLSIYALISHESLDYLRLTDAASPPKCDDVGPLPQGTSSKF